MISKYFLLIFLLAPEQICFKPKNYVSSAIDFLRIELRATNGQYNEERDLVVTPEGKYCSDIDLAVKQFVRPRVCKAQASGGLACSKVGAEVQLVFPPALTSYSAEQ